MNVGRVVWVAAVLLLFGVAMVATPTTSEARKAGVVISPKPGQVVHSHLVRVRVRSSDRSALRVRLNGTRVGADFDRSRNGVRRLKTSISHGLRRGRNVLRVRVRRPGGKTRRVTVRFVVRTRRPLVGAGRNRTIAVDGTVQLRGRLAALGRRPSTRWKLVRAPRRAPVHRARGSRGTGRSAAASAKVAADLPASPTDPKTGLPVLVPPATIPAADDAPPPGPPTPLSTPLGVLTAPANLTAGFATTVPGTYTLRLIAGSGSQQTTDLVTLDATPRNKLVPMLTMTAADSSNGDQRGIKVGDTTFLLRDAVGRSSTSSGGASDSFLQALVLNRKTTEFVWNRKYADVAALDADLAPLDSSKLVILVLQPNSTARDYGPLQTVFERIGVPDYGGLPTTPGGISAIGVPGMSPGQADVNVLPAGSGMNAVMQGYLTPDEFSGFGFVPSGRVPFDYVPSASDPCVQANGGGRSCDGKAGFYLRDQNGRTLAPGPKDGQFYETGTPGQVAKNNSEAARMAADLAAISFEDVVTIRTVSFQPAGQQTYVPPIGPVDKTRMVPLANAVAKVGGTRDVFNRIARLQGAADSYGTTYTLVGWQGANEGDGAEAGAGLDGAGDAGGISGELRPDEQSRYRPAQVKPTSYPPDLSDVLFAPPTKVWPLDNNPGASRAISYLGTLDNRLGPDPRSAYWTQNFADLGLWNTFKSMVSAAKYADVPPSFRGQFTEAEFNAARSQLAQELGWVGRVRSYLAAVAKPFSRNALKSWEDAENIADAIYTDAYKPKGDAASVWLDFTEILLNLAGPLTGGATSVIASLMELGGWAFASDADGRPTGADLKIKADAVAGTLSNQMQDAAKTYLNMGNVIVSDPVKLEAVGSKANCNPAPGCTDQWSFTGDQQNQVAADLERSVERVAYEKLYPLGFHVFRLNIDTNPWYAKPPGGTRDPRTYKCTYYPWYYYSDSAIKYATSALLQEYNPLGPDNQWQVLVMSRPPERSTTVRGTPPSDKTLKRMFGPVPSPASPDGEKPSVGGLGMSPSRLMAGAKADWDYWDPDSSSRPTFDDCAWE